MYVHRRLKLKTSKSCKYVLSLNEFISRNTWAEMSQLEEKSVLKEVSSKLKL